MESPSSVNLARQLLLNAYSPRATAACYNSFVSPVQAQIADLTGQLPDHRAADALAALGFGTVMIDKAHIDPRDLQTFFDGLQTLDNSERLHPVGKTGRLLAYRLSTGTPVRSDFDLIAGGSSSAAPASATVAASTPLEFTFTNHGSDIFRLPDPIVPSDLVVRWRDAGGQLVQESRARALLPMALAPRASLAITLTLRAPDAPGRYVVDVARAAAPGTVLASRGVEVSAPGAG
jgi:hypothetical protein